uniref:Fibronectin type-III domain-containing protein n=1 Tax=Heterorhabditis bacteriophora TaxID=37862 RepID=A0A1I7XS60_HETBA
MWTKTFTTPSLPGELFVTVEPMRPREALVTWDLPDKDQKWNYGVDITYKLKQLGGCNEATTGNQEPITKLNVQDKQIMLENLQPGSVYEVVVTPRRPPSLHSSIVAPKTVRTFRTKNDVPTGAPLNLQSTIRKDTELASKKQKLTSIHVVLISCFRVYSLLTQQQKISNISCFFNILAADKVLYKYYRADDSNPTEMELSEGKLSCSGYKSNTITSANLCAAVNNLQPSTTYRFAVQGQATSGNWGEWSNDYFATTRNEDNVTLGGSLKLLSGGHDNLKVKWTPPALIGEKIDNYKVKIHFMSVQFLFPRNRLYRDLNPVTQYNVTVQGLSEKSHLWFISSVFATTDFVNGLLSWLPAPTDLHLIEKTDTMLHVDWVPPEIFDPEQRELITHYRTPTTLTVEWEPVWGRSHNGYTVRYLRLKDNEAQWTEEEARESKELLCPKDGCGRLCYLVFNLPHKPSDYVFQKNTKYLFSLLLAGLVRIGDGSVIGGYLNYPLVKGKKYNYEVYTVWNISGAPVYGRLRGGRSQKMFENPRLKNQVY